MASERDEVLSEVVPNDSNVIARNEGAESNLETAFRWGKLQNNLNFPSA